MNESLYPATTHDEAYKERVVKFFRFIDGIDDPAEIVIPKPEKLVETPQQS